MVVVVVVLEGLLLLTGGFTADLVGPPVSGVSGPNKGTTSCGLSSVAVTGCLLLTSPPPTLDEGLTRTLFATSGTSKPELMAA